MMRALIVDDHAQNNYLLRALLEGHGFVVDEARHGAEALTRARQLPPTVVISDLLMPVLDGYSLLRYWRAATFTDPKDERLAMALGADAFIIKPTEPDRFLEQIREVLALKDRGDLPSASDPAHEEQALLRDYNEVLIRKLEKKALEAELDLNAVVTDMSRMLGRLIGEDVTLTTVHRRVRRP